MNVQQILIADDDLDDIELLTEGIVSCKPTIEISYVTDGQQLMTKLNEGFIPDILILDINMPCLDGKDCLTMIRATREFDDIIIVIYSLVEAPSAREECLSAGANYYVVKPTEIAEIIKFGGAISKGNFKLYQK
jgi:CheY-like chemotaxis protein